MIPPCELMLFPALQELSFWLEPMTDPLILIFGIVQTSPKHLWGSSHTIRIQRVKRTQTMVARLRNLLNPIRPPCLSRLVVHRVDQSQQPGSWEDMRGQPMACRIFKCGWVNVWFGSMILNMRHSLTWHDIAHPISTSTRRLCRTCPAAHVCSKMAGWGSWKPNASGGYVAVYHRSFQSLVPSLIHP